MTASDDRANRAAPGLGERVVALAEALAAHTDEPGRLTRLYLSPAHRRAAEAVRDLMAAAGLAAGIDAAGSVVGRWGTAQGGTLIVGSHLDSVVDAGRYDGPLGVLCGLVAVEELARRGADLPFALEVIGFGDEENVRFPTSLSTSNALAGRYRPDWLEGRDAAGTSLREALVAFGAEPDAIPGLARRREDVLGYLEVHIEQGPRLEAEDRAVGIVSAITGITRARCTVVGVAGHAGTVPMGLRRDALAATAAMILAIEAVGRREAGRGVVATVGAAEVRPGAVNVVPGRVEFTLDLRAPDDALRPRLVAEVLKICRGIATERGVAFSHAVFMDSPAVTMDEDLAGALEAAARGLGHDPPRLPSGATHDAGAMAHLCPAALLFVRCRGGVSHNPAESITAADADAAVQVLVEAILDLARRRPPRR